MGVIESASGVSAWRGYEYYKDKRVIGAKESENGTIIATVLGSGDALYKVELDIEHPRKSKCNCPHADGKRIVCKHMVAVYFTVFPKEADRFYREVMEYQEEEERRVEELTKKVRQYVSKMKKSELHQALIDLLFDGPEWQYDKFIRDNSIDIV